MFSSGALPENPMTTSQNNVITLRHNDDLFINK